MRDEKEGEPVKESDDDDGVKSKLGLFMDDGDIGCTAAAFTDAAVATVDEVSMRECDLG